MHASLLGVCYESMVIDNDMLGAINRTVRGIEVNDETLSLDAMRDVCVDGPCHYLGHGQTLDLMQKEYIYPNIGDRTSPKEWAEQGKPVLIEKARNTVDEILGSHYPTHIAAEIDTAIREKFEVKLSLDAMNKNNGEAV